MNISLTQRYRRRLAAPVILALLVVTLTACASKYVWQNSRLAEDRLSGDTAECHYNSEKLINDELKRSSPFGSQGRGQLERQFTMFDARKRRDQMFSNCMRDKGYIRVKVKPKQKAKPKAS
jgi:hypothetical protein